MPTPRALLLMIVLVLTGCAGRPTPYNERFAIVPDCKPSKVSAVPGTLPAPDSDTFLDPDFVLLTTIDELAIECGVTWDKALQIYADSRCQK